jgi:hypothetical protein
MTYSMVEVVVCAEGFSVTFLDGGGVEGGDDFTKRSADGRGW